MEIIISEWIIPITTGIISGIAVLIIQMFTANNIKKISIVSILILIFVTCITKLLLIVNPLTLIEVPDVRFKTKDQAELILKEKGLKLKIVEQWNKSIPKYLVISQDPVHGLNFQKGITITLYISKGENINQNSTFPPQKKISMNGEKKTIPTNLHSKKTPVKTTKGNKSNESLILIKTYLVKVIFIVFSIVFIIILIIKILLKRKYKKNLKENFSTKKIRQSTSYYIEPTCIIQNDSNFQYKEMKTFSVLDDYFYKDNLNSNKMLIIADAGMGKTSLLINYFMYNFKLLNMKRLLKFYFVPLKIYIIPLGPSNVNKEIDLIEDKENTIICLDAFDEDFEAIDKYPERLKHLIEITGMFKNIIVTCRKNFFDNEDIAIFLKEFDFRKLTIKSFQEKDVNRYISKHYNFFQQEEKNKAFKLKDELYKKDKLEYSPMVISNIPKLIDKFEKNRQCTIYDLYSLMLEKHIERIYERVDDVVQRWTHINKYSLEQFFNTLAYDMYKNNLFAISEIDFKDKLYSYVEKNEVMRTALLDSITDNFLLEKTTNNCYQFIHLTILEFLYLRHFINLDYSYRSKVRWSNIQKSFTKDLILQKAYGISDGDISKISDNKFDLSKADLSNEKKLFLEINKKWPKNILLKDVNLERTNLEEATLIGVDLSGSNLEEANLNKADLTGANLSCANLEKTNLERTKLSKAKFYQAKGLPVWISKVVDENFIFHKDKLTELIKQEGFEAEMTELINQEGFKIIRKYCLEDEDFINCNLSDKNFINIDFINCKFKNVTFKNTTFKCVHFSQSEFINVNFKDALFIDVSGVSKWIEKSIVNGKFSQKRLIEMIKYQKVLDVSFVLLKNSNFNNETLERINFSNSFLNNADFSNSKLFDIDFKNSCLIGANFTNTKFTDVEFEGANLKDIINLPEWLKAGVDENKIFSYNKLIERIKQSNHKLLSSANLKNKNLNGINLEKADLRNADLRGVALRESNLANADLSGADLRRTNLQKANFECANFQNANLERANLKGANLKNANLIEADLSFCNCEGANLNGAQLKNAKKNKINLKNANTENTIIPQERRYGQTLNCELYSNAAIG